MTNTPTEVELMVALGTIPSTYAWCEYFTTLRPSGKRSDFPGTRHRKGTLVAYACQEYCGEEAIFLKFQTPRGAASCWRVWRLKTPNALIPCTTPEPGNVVHFQWPPSTPPKSQCR